MQGTSPRARAGVTGGAATAVLLDMPRCTLEAGMSQLTDAGRVLERPRRARSAVSHSLGARQAGKPLGSAVVFRDRRAGDFAADCTSLRGCRAVGPARRGLALDFGCSVGPLTQALARHFDRVAGADISDTVLGHARRLNALPDRLREGGELTVRVTNDSSVGWNAARHGSLGMRTVAAVLLLGMLGPVHAWAQANAGAAIVVSRLPGLDYARARSIVRRAGWPSAACSPAARR